LIIISKWINYDDWLYYKEITTTTTVSTSVPQTSTLSTSTTTPNYQNVSIFTCDFDGLNSLNNFTKCGNITIQSSGSPISEG
jgi:hypothetical protein